MGSSVLEIPTVSVLLFDDRKRVLLVRHVEGNDWTTPGGMIEPYEIPSNAALREMWEETGLYVELTHIVGVFGGDICSSIYANGDKVAWVSTVFAARLKHGVLKADGEEALEARYFTRGATRGVDCKPHVHLFLDAAYAHITAAHFQPPSWEPRRA